MTAGGSGQMSTITDIQIVSAEKRRDDHGKFYVYEIVIAFSDGSQQRVWRRYSQFDALRDTMADLLKTSVRLPALTRKLYLTRSAVRQVAIHRQPKLQLFLRQLLRFQERLEVSQPLRYFLMPTIADEARDKTPDPEYIIYFDDDTTESGLCSTTASTHFTTKATALYDFQGRADDELSYSCGDEMTVIAESSEDWLVCEHNGREGLVAKSYIELHTIDTSQDASRATTPTAGGRTKPLLRRTSKEMLAAQAPQAVDPIQELQLTEQAFVDNLMNVRDGFFKSMRGLVSFVEAKTFFNNWDELISVHQKLSEDLKGANGDEAGAALSSHLPNMAPAYMKYCRNIPAAQALYETKQADKRFVAWEASFSTMNKPTLNQIMRPVQRVMKYPLIVREIQKKHQALAWTKALQAAERLAIDADTAMKQQPGDNRGGSPSNSLSANTAVDEEPEVAQGGHVAAAVPPPKPPPPPSARKPSLALADTNPSEAEAGAPSNGLINPPPSTTVGKSNRPPPPPPPTPGMHAEGASISGHEHHRGPGRPPPPAAKPSALASKPSLPGSKPSVPGQKPPVSTGKPSIAANKPAIPGHKPAVPSHKPAIPGKKPALAAHKPAVPGHKPAIPGKKPVIPANKPAIPGTKPAVPGKKPQLRGHAAHSSSSSHADSDSDGSPIRRRPPPPSKPPPVPGRRYSSASRDSRSSRDFSAPVHSSTSVSAVTALIRRQQEQWCSDDDDDDDDEWDD